LFNPRCDIYTRGQRLRDRAAVKSFQTSSDAKRLPRGWWRRAYLTISFGGASRPLGEAETHPKSLARPQRNEDNSKTPFFLFFLHQFFKKNPVHQWTKKSWQICSLASQLPSQFFGRFYSKNGTSAFLSSPLPFI
jgi:hypothetical protein